MYCPPGKFRAITSALARDEVKEKAAFSQTDRTSKVLILHALARIHRGKNEVDTGVP